MNNENIKVVWVDTNSIKPYNRNARKNDETVMKLCEIIPKVGFNQPVVIDKHNVIVKGHSRWKAAVRLGMKQIPCIISENDDETNKLDRLADNKIQEFSKWDDELLATELASINIPDLELSDFGFDFSMKELEQPQTSAPYAPPFPAYAANENGVECTPADDVPTYPAAYTPPTKPVENFITEKDVARTYAKQESEYGSVTCPKCGQVVLYKK